MRIVFTIMSTLSRDPRINPRRRAEPEYPPIRPEREGRFPAAAAYGPAPTGAAACTRVLSVRAPEAHRPEFRSSAAVGKTGRRKLRPQASGAWARLFREMVEYRLVLLAEPYSTEPVYTSEFLSGGPSTAASAVFSEWPRRVTQVLPRSLAEESETPPKRAVFRKSSQGVSDPREAFFLRYRGT